MARPPLQIGTHGKIRTQQNPDDTWRAITNFRHRDGKTRPMERQGPTEDKALRRLRKAIRDLNDSPKAVTLTKTSRYKDLADPWLAQVKSRSSKTTVQTYTSVLNRIVLKRVGDLQLPEITTATLEDLFDELEEEGFSAAYRRNIRTVIRGPLGYALRRGLISSNPIADISDIKGKGVRKVRSLTSAERVGLLAGLDSLAERDPYFRNSALPGFVRFMLGTGVRIGEGVAVRWQDLNLTDSPVTVDGVVRPPHSVHINGNVVFVTGEGLVRHDGKTDNANRLLVLPEFLVTMLLVGRDEDATEGEPVFPSERLGWRYPHNVRRALRGATKKIWEHTGEDYRWVTSHVFRKTAATILDDEALSPRQVADQLGHAKPSMTQDVYMGRGTVNPAAAAALHAAYTQ